MLPFLMMMPEQSKYRQTKRHQECPLKARRDSGERDAALGGNLRGDFNPQE
jgi:hypothetical protein